MSRETRVARHGEGRDCSSSLRVPRRSSAAPAVALAADGDLDTNFNGTGTLTGNFGGSGAQLFRGVVQPDGKLVVVGNRDADGVVARFNPDGTPDPSFGMSGTGYTIVDSGATTGGERLRAVALQGNPRSSPPATPASRVVPTSCLPA